MCFLWMSIHLHQRLAADAIFFIPVPTVALLGQRHQGSRHPDEFFAAIVERRISPLSRAFGLGFAQNLKGRFALEHPQEACFQISLPGDDVQAFAQITIVMGIAASERGERSRKQLARAAILCVRTFGAKKLEASGSTFKQWQTLQTSPQEPVGFAERMRHETKAALSLDFGNGRAELA